MSPQLVNPSFSFALALLALALALALTMLHLLSLIQISFSLSLSSFFLISSHLGVNVEIVQKGRKEAVSGTSCSAPIFAGDKQHRKTFQNCPHSQQTSFFMRDEPNDGRKTAHFV
jgi:hypothetical protein